MNKIEKISDIIGKTISSVHYIKDSNSITFKFNDNSSITISMNHNYDYSWLEIYNGILPERIDDNGRER